MHFLRSHFTLVSSSVFLTGFGALAACAALGVLGPSAAAELAACGAVLAACTHLALILRRLTGETSQARAGFADQNRDLTAVAEESRAELSARMETLSERMAGTGVLMARARVPADVHDREAARPRTSGTPAAPSEPPAVPAEANGVRNAVHAGATEHAEAVS